MSMYRQLSKSSAYLPKGQRFVVIAGGADGRDPEETT